MMETIVIFDNENGLIIEHSLTAGEMLIAFLLVTIISLIVSRWLYDVILSKKEK